jgi:threonine synthase
MRAVVFLSTDCQPDKLEIMVWAGAWVFQVPDGYPAAVRRAGRVWGPNPPGRRPWPACKGP